ncbi:MAG: hypothetical protein KDI44_00650 [Thiothrix sp.]|nr:hypothetical protein [Thiothrix sp.]HPQ97654.1 hypothetical protein [Thiolinea sp.]
MNSVNKGTSIILTILGLSLAATDTLAASLQGATGQLNLSATIGDVPAFRTISWSVMRQDDDDEIIRTVHRHSAVIDLEPGIYRVNTTLQDKTRTNRIVIKEGAKHTLMVKLD